jgi:DNA-3-methyladenine glycosylase I
VFAGFDFTAVARFGKRDVIRLLGDPAIVRHRGKIEAVINNARRAVELVESEGSLAHYLWSFEPDPPMGELSRGELAARSVTAESRALARDLKRRGWRFVGPTTMYAFMQAMGLVNDHLTGCPAGASVEEARSSFRRP